ncbi:MAG TPA: hypothetical protein VIV57_19205 [Anaeromyxobacter sp.]
MSSTAPISDGTWISDEPRLGSVARLVLARALRRRTPILVVALLATGGATVLRWLKHPTHEATLYFRLEEGDLGDVGHGLRPPSDIRQHIANVALSRTQLEQIMRKYHWSEGWLARDRAAAIDEFRASIEISVDRNYFIYPRSPGEDPRSAEVRISLSGPDEEQVRVILREIGDAILLDQEVQRRGRLQEAREMFRAQLEHARSRTRTLQDLIARLALEAAGSDERAAIGARARLAVLQAEAKGALEQELALEKRAAAVAFNAAKEEERLGMRFEFVDERVATFAPRLTAVELALRAALIFGAVLTVTATVVGAFDDRIYAPQDLAAWGLPLFGALPRFPGDDAGSYRARAPAGRAWGP